MCPRHGCGTVPRGRLEFQVIRWPEIRPESPQWQKRKHIFPANTIGDSVFLPGSGVRGPVGFVRAGRLRARPACADGGVEVAGPSGFLRDLSCCISSCWRGRAQAGRWGPSTRPRPSRPAGADRSNPVLVKLTLLNKKKAGPMRNRSAHPLETPGLGLPTFDRTPSRGRKKAGTSAFRAPSTPGNRTRSSPGSGDGPTPRTAHAPDRKRRRRPGRRSRP